MCFLLWVNHRAELLLVVNIHDSQPVLSTSEPNTEQHSVDPKDYVSALPNAVPLTQTETSSV